MKKENTLRVALLVSVICNIYGLLSLNQANNVKSEAVALQTELHQKIPTVKEGGPHTKKVAALEKKVKDLQFELQQQEEFFSQKVQPTIDAPGFQMTEEGYKTIEKLDENSDAYKELSKAFSLMRKNDKMIADYFRNLDTSILTPSELELYNQFLTQMEKVDKLKQEAAKETNLMKQIEYAQKVADMMMQAKGLEAARKVGMNTLAEQLGYKGESAKELTDYVDYIYRSTSPSAALDDMIGNGEDENGNRVTARLETDFEVIEVEVEEEEK